MTVRVVVLHGAEADLRELQRYVCKRFGASVWADTLKSVRQSFRRIAMHPELGHPPDELAVLGLVQYRQVLAGMNRIVYQRMGSIAYVHLVCDVRRDLKSVLMRRLMEAS